MGLCFLPGAVGALLAVQAPQATVTGEVRDGRTGEALTGAAVTLPDIDRATLTGSRGRYVVRQVPAGPQHLTVRYIGHAPRTVHALVPPSGTLEINIVLQPLPVRLTTVEVRHPASVRAIDIPDGTTFPDRALSIASVRNHPLLAEPDVLQALGGGDVVLEPESPSGVHVRGGASDQTAYVLDGIPVFSPYHTAGVFAAWNPDAIDRVRLSAAAPSPVYPDALSGVVEAVTRTPGAQIGAQGTISTTHARVTADGPLGGRGGGYLVSMRSGFPGLAASSEESYLRGEGGDWLAKIELPALGGALRILGYENSNELTTASITSAEAGAPPGRHRNAFEWGGRSYGAEWRRGFARGAVRLLAWSAESEAGATWAHHDGPVVLSTARHDDGLLASTELGARGGTTTAGLRLARSATSYTVEPDSVGGPRWRLRGRTPIASAFVQHTHRYGDRMELEAGTSVTAVGRQVHLSPRARLTWSGTERMTFSGGYARLHQFSQSLRNPESVVGRVFPADLYVGSGASGVPVARSDQGVLAAEYRPIAGTRLVVQGYVRRSGGLLLVAPRTGEPFATGAFAVGGGVSRGASLDAAVTTTRVGVMASYGVQRVRLDRGDSSYVPDHAATQHFDAGVVAFPSPTWSIRLGAAGALGRRTTAAAGAFEWEACNLLDAGCEFAGSPRYGDESLGRTRLPAYVRLDLGIRKHWHIEVGGRPLLVALFGTVTNVLDRGNVLTYAREPGTGAPAAIAMRPLAPLVVGLDWRF